MKIYYATTKGQADKHIESFVTETIPAILNETGHEIFTYIYNPADPKNELSFDTLLNAILTADAFIGEMSRPSQTLGFQLASALTASKPTLYLYNSARNGKPDVSISNNPSRLLRIGEYETEVTLKSIIDTFLNFADQQSRSTRTSFISTKRIDEFVTSQSKKLGISKGEAIRQLLDDAIIRTIKK